MVPHKKHHTPFKASKKSVQRTHERFMKWALEWLDFKLKTFGISSGEYDALKHLKGYSLYLMFELNRYSPQDLIRSNKETDHVEFRIDPIFAGIRLQEEYFLFAAFFAIIEEGSYRKEPNEPLPKNFLKAKENWHGAFKVTGIEVIW